MGEINYKFLLDFDSVEDAKSTQTRLEQLDQEYRGELAPIMQALLDADHVGDQDINTDGVQRKQTSVYLFAYGGRSSQPPYEAAAHLYQIGCSRAYLRVFYDEGEDGQYYLGKKRVNINTFTAALRGGQDKEATRNLYLPTGRVSIEAKLLKFEWDSNAYGDYCIMQFETSNGDSFYYKGNSEKLLLLTRDEYAPLVTFSAVFEATYLDSASPPVSVAKRPTKINVTQLDPRSGGLSVLRGDEKKFAAEAIGVVVQQYFEDYDFDCNPFFLTLTESSFLNLDFAQLLKHAARSQVEQFLAFGLYIYAAPWLKTSLEIEIQEPRGKVNFHELADHVEALEVHFFQRRRDSSFFCADWATDDSYIEITISKRSIKLSISRRVKVCSGDKSVKAQYHQFIDNPGYASKVDWIDLFNCAKQDAEAGHINSMTVYASLLDSSLGWDRSPEEAKLWRDRAGKAGDGGALLQQGMNLDRQGLLDEALEYFRRAAVLGVDQAWDEIERQLRRNADVLQSVTPERPPETEVDRSYWLTDDKVWMRNRRARWKELEPMLKPLYKVKDLAKRKKYFLTGELPVNDGEHGNKPSMLNMSLLDLLWLHPNENPELLLKLREQYFKQRGFTRRKFHDWQRGHSSTFITAPALYSEDWGRGYEPRPIDDYLLYFKVLNGNYADYGYFLHGEFIPFREPREGIDELMQIGNWFNLDTLLEPNKQLVLLDTETLEWWYQTLPTDLDFSKTSNTNSLPYLFRTLYRLHRFAERGIDCPLREQLGTQLRALLEECPFCDEIKRLWEYVRDTDFILKNAWDKRYDPRVDWNKHKSNY
ncbi:MAG: hypothetical protein GY942_24665 [Aestuariibacter sp.]|nr:hypothetical protein [Aestuariibacter sp.]